MADTPNERSGSRWEPEDSEHVTENLTPTNETEVIPGLGAQVPATPKKRIPKAAAAVAIVAAATIGGAAIGMALAGNRSQPVSDTSVTSDSTAGTGQGQGLAPGYGDPDGDGYGPGDGHDGFGHHGPGGH